jgi:Kdo2-lipid IVA lauroyltransferase/acyltransferase
MTAEKQSFKSPRYWGTHLGLKLLRLVAKLSPKQRAKLGNFLGDMMAKFAVKRRRIASKNLSLCFPELSDDQRQILLAKNMRASGRALIETASCWYSDLSPQQSNSKVTGQQYLDAALAKGKGVILLSFHMTSLEMGGCLLGSHYDFLAMYKPNKNPLFEKAMVDGRTRHLKGLLDRSNVRGTIKALRNNQIVWYAADQNYGGKTTVFVPFFDIQTATITATTKLAKMTGAAVVPFTQRRLEGLDSYQLTLYPAFEDFPGQSEEQDAARINRFLEEHLKQYPVDYMWLHQRFRNRPKGEPPIY